LENHAYEKQIYGTMLDREGSESEVSKKAACLRDILSIEVGNNGIDKVIPHNNGSDGLPVTGIFAQKQANGLQGQFHNGWRVRHGPHFHKLLFLYLFHGYK